MARRDINARGISRRQWLATTAGGTAGILAGCSSSSDDPQDGSNASSPDDPEDGPDTFHTTIASVPSDQNFNVFATSNSVFIDVRNVMHSWPGIILPHNSEVTGLLAEDWNIGADTVELTLRDDVTWHNGDPVTARDFIVTKQMYQLTQGVENPMFTDFTEVDDRTVEFAINSDSSLNEDIVALNLFARTSQKQLNCPESVYGDMLSDLQSAQEEGEEALNQVVQQVTQTQIEEQVGAGPWKVEEVTQQKIEFSRHDGHPGGADLNFDSLVMHYVENEEQENRGMIDDEYDALKQATSKEDVRNEYPDHAEYITKPTYSGKGIVINQDDEVLQDVRVRKALANVIDPVRHSDRFPNQLAVAETYYSGISGFSVDAWISEDLRSSYSNYDGKDEDMAASLLQDANFSRDGDSWIRPNGEPLSLTVKAGSGDQGTFDAQMIEEDLTNFGIDVSASVMENSTVFGQIREGDYQLGVWGWGALNVAHPYQDMWEMFDAGGWWSQQTNQPAEVEAPSVGEPDGSPKTYSVQDRIANARNASREEMQSTIEELSWVFNQTVPIIPIGENGPDSLITTDDWSAPLDDPRANAFPPHFMFSQTGELQAKDQ